MDVRHAARSLGRTPAFTIAAILTLALGIGANTALFTLFDAIVLRALPVEASGELFALREADPAAAETQADMRRAMRFSYPRFLDLAAALPPGTSLAAMSRVTRLQVRDEGSTDAEAAQGQLVSPGFFQTFRAGVARGRTFQTSDNTAGVAPVAIVSDGYWQRRLGADPAVVGRTVVVNGTSATIVGVTQPGFTGAWADAPADIWLPAVMQHAIRYRGNASASNADLSEPWMPQDRIAWLNLVGRAPRETMASVLTRLAAANRAGLERDAAAEGLEADRRRILDRRLTIDPFARGFSTLRDQLTDPLRLLGVLVAVVLLVACVNVANLLLARGAARHGEIALRVSLGATRWRLVRQCLTESMMLGLLGAAAGVVAGVWTSRLLARLLPEASRSVIEPMLVPNARILAFAAIAAVFTAVLFGLLPAIRAWRSEALGGSDRRTIASMTGMRALVAAQLGMSFVVVVTAALLSRSLINLDRFDPGFNRSHLVAVSFDPAASGYAPADLPALYRRLVETATATFGVQSAAVSMFALVDGGQGTTSYQMEGYERSRTESIDVNLNLVGTRYFDTVGMPIVEGRGWVPEDNRPGRRVAIVNEAMARRYFAGRALGKRLGEENLDAEIVGVVRDARVLDIRTAAAPMIFFPIDQEGGMARALEVRVSGDPAAAIDALRRALREAAPALHLTQVRTVAEQLALTTAREKQMAYLSTGFGILALLLACVGLYGVLSYTVSRRRREVGVRMAVGASPRDILLLLLRDGGVVGLTGLAGGLVAALVTQRPIGALLFGVNPTDPATYAGVAGALALTTLAACYLPARRAAAADPNMALRAE